MTVTDDEYDKLRIKDEQKKKKDPKNVKRGKKARKDGKAFEVLVRKELTEKGWIVCRFDNQVDLVNSVGTLVQSKGKFNPFTRSMMMVSGGFPDFICFKLFLETDKVWDIQLVECKINGYLDPVEREKIEWIKTNLKIPVFVASKIKEGRKTVIVYEEK